MKYRVKDYPHIMAEVEQMSVEELLRAVICPNIRAKEELKNPDLWDRLFSLTEMHEVTFVWVKGHNGHDYNERCDALATGYADSL